MAERKSAQKEIERKLKELKRRYSRKLEKSFQAMKSKLYWKNVATITGHKQQKKKTYRRVMKLSWQTD